jgi:F-type H+-transporting ATPase subunit b
MALRAIGTAFESPVRLGLWVAPALWCLSAAPARAAGGLVLVPEPFTLGALLVGFVFLIAPLNALIFRPIFRVLDERDARIEGARTRAAQLAGEAEALTSRYRDEIRQAREEAEAGRKEQLDAARSELAIITSDAKNEAETEIAGARAEISDSLLEARETLRSASQDLAKAAAERILGRAV